MNEDLEIRNCSYIDGFIYQFPVCARDVGFYLGMLIGGFAFAISGRSGTKIPNIIFLILFIFPMAIDGFTQLLNLRESTNELRLSTGFIGGFIVPFYLIPILNRIYIKGDKE